jgi:uncharacterized membrane protein YdbT with pleckstrin-like domain
MTNNDHFTEDDIGDEMIKWSGNPAIESQIGSIITGIIMLPFAGMGILVLIGTYIKVNYTTYAITDKALYKKRGMLSEKTKRVPLSKIQNTEYSRSFFEKRFEFGTVEVSSAGSSGKELSFSSVSNPKDVQELINELSNKNKSTNTNQNINKTDQDLKKEVVKTRENLEEIVDYLNDK